MKYISLVLFVTILFLSSCNKTPDKISGVIPKEDFTQILYEIHLADGILSDGNVFKPYRNTKEYTLYDTIFEAYGYDREKFISTLNVYAQYPNDLNDIYNLITEQLAQKLQEIVEITNSQEEQKEKFANSLWRRRRDWNFLEDSTINFNSLNYKIQTRGLGSYIIEADVSLAKEDKTKKPYMTASLTYFNGETTQTENLNKIKLKKNGEKTHYTLKIENRNPDVTHIEGNLFQLQIVPNSIPNLKVENITILYTPFDGEEFLPVKEPEIKKRNKENNPKQDTLELWEGINYYSLPEHGKYLDPTFNIPLKEGRYIISVDILLYPDDLSKSPTVGWSLYSSQDQTRTWIMNEKINKDGKWHNFIKQIDIIDDRHDFLKGNLFWSNPDNNTPGWQKHAEIKNISIQYISFSDTLK